MSVLVLACVGTSRHVHNYVSVRVPAHESVCVLIRVEYGIVCEPDSKNDSKKPILQPLPHFSAVCRFYILNPLQPIQDEIGCRTCVKYEHCEIQRRNDIFKV